MNLELTPGVKKVNSAIHRINLYPEGSLFQSPRWWAEQIEKMGKKPHVDWGEKVRWSSRRFSVVHTDREPETGYPEGNAVSLSNT